MIARFLILLMLITGSIWPAASKPRVVSINMCTDQLLLALADPDQILGLSSLSRDRNLSWYWKEAARFPRLSGQAEDVLPLKPDLVFTALFVKTTTRALLRQQGLLLAEFGSANTLQEVRDQIQQAGHLLEQPDRAAAFIATIDATVTRLTAHPSIGHPAILPLERRGWVAGKNTLITDLIKILGGHNLAADSAGNDGALLSLEEIVRLNPDIMLVTGSSSHAEDQGSAFLQHPALTHLIGHARKISLPESLTVCAGPMLVEALEKLHQELIHPPEKGATNQVVPIQPMPSSVRQAP